MNWASARERLGTELIGARENVALRWRSALRDQGVTPDSLERTAAELVLQAGAALADEMPSATPWTRCGGLLRIDVRRQGSALAFELTELWSAMAEVVSRISLGDEEERRAREVLGLQLEAALRGAAAELGWALLDEQIEDAALRFGGVTIVSWHPGESGRAETRAA